uniref:DUF4806 domain-containing protein n=1 Tax=Daphnia galeata TaxID=27404 RepID=A0A8J2S1B1_9CRUS|nr:unnamed protein product [Daphnia galeata]
MSAIVRVPEKPYKRYWIAKVYDDAVANQQVFSVLNPKWCQPELLKCKFPADMKVSEQVKKRGESMKPADSDWITFSYVYFSQTDDIKSAYRRVERLSKGETFEESEQVQRLRIANKKYADDYEIGESSKASEKAQSQESSRTTPAPVKRKSLAKKPTEQIISNSPSIPNSIVAEVSGKSGQEDKGKSLKTIKPTATVTTVPNSESLEKDMVAPEGLFQRNCQVTLTGCDDVSNDSGINIETIEESQHIRYGNEEDFESSYAETTRASKATKATKATNKDHRINFSQERSNSKKKSSELEIVLTPAQMSRLLLQMNQRSKRTEKMVIEIRNNRVAGVIAHPSGLELLKDKLPTMPFDDFDELVKFKESIASDDGVKNDLLSFLQMVPGISEYQTAKNMMSSLISVPLSQLCTLKGKSVIRDKGIKKHKFSQSCPTILACISAACLSRHKDKYDPNQFKTALQKFFIESGDRNGGADKRKRKVHEKELEGQIKQNNLSTSASETIFESSEEDLLESSENEAANDRKKKREKNLEFSSYFFSSDSDY